MQSHSESMHARPAPSELEGDTIHPLIDRGHVGDGEKVELDPM